MNILLIVFTAFLISLIATTTRGDGENIRMKVTIGTILGTILFFVLEFLGI